MCYTTSLNHFHHEISPLLLPRPIPSPPKLPFRFFFSIFASLFPHSSFIITGINQCCFYVKDYGTFHRSITAYHGSHSSLNCLFLTDTIQGQQFLSLRCGQWCLTSLSLVRDGLLPDLILCRQSSCCAHMSTARLHVQEILLWSSCPSLPPYFLHALNHTEGYILRDFLLMPDHMANRKGQTGCSHRMLQICWVGLFPAPGQKSQVAEEIFFQG